MDAIAAQPQAWQGCAAGQAEGPEAIRLLAKPAHKAKGAAGPAGKAPGGGQLLVQKLPGFDAEQFGEARLDAP